MHTITLAATTLPDAAPLALLDVAEAAGFHGVGLRLGPLPSASTPHPPLLSEPRLVRNIKRRLAESPLIVLDIYSLYLTPSFDLDACRATLELGAQFGARYVVVVGRDNEPARAGETLARICEQAEPLGLTAVLEFAPHRWPANLAQALQLIQQVNRSNLAVLPDPAHLFGSGGSLADLRSIDRNLIRYSQYCDVVRSAGVTGDAISHAASGAIARCLPGEGQLPLSEWLEALPGGLPVSIECPPPDTNASHSTWAQILAERMRAAGYLRSDPAA